ncbi:MAG: two-component system response regulator [Herbaspirillum sp.]|jgi:adenylate cyclase|nr:two-component system response regulator [Herbaspirillum sp.]
MNERLMQDTDLVANDTAVVLVVDDEAGILSALKRLFRPVGYQVLTAESGPAALEILAAEHVDLIISDMRMPGMTGAQFLAQAKASYPDIVRILLTGYSDVSSTVAAINEGGIYHYLPKPWDEHDLLLTVQRALEQQQLKNEAQRLTQIVLRQNEELSAFNAKLEQQVVARTEELRQTVLFLENSEQEIKNNLLTMLKVFSNLIELRAGAFGYSGRVGELSRNLGAKLSISLGSVYKINEAGLQDLMIAGLLHAVGKIGLSDELVRKPMDKMSSDETRLFMTHPLKGQLALTPVAAYAAAGSIIRHQYERYDGRGSPSGLVGDAIPIGSRILALTRDFEALLSGAIATQPLPLEKTLALLKAQRGHRYDPIIVDQFLSLVEEEGMLQSVKTRLVKPLELVPGMQLADDLRTPDGVLLLIKDSVIHAQNIAQIRRFEQTQNVPLQISILI